MDLARSRVGGWLVAIGSLGVSLAAALYATTPASASIPLPIGLPLSEALAQTLTSSHTLAWAGTVGLVADVLLIGGCGLLALRPAEAVAKQLLWIGLGVSMGIFILVDALAGQVMPTVAALSGTDMAAFALAREAFDISVTLGIFTFGMGFLAAFGVRGWPVALRYAALALGSLALVTSGLHIVGVTVTGLFGASIGAVGIMGIVVGVYEARTAARATPLPA